LLESRGFELQQDPGTWKTSDGIQVDLLVPERWPGRGVAVLGCVAMASA
jgi:hypothetical protein